MALSACGRCSHRPLVDVGIGRQVAMDVKISLTPPCIIVSSVILHTKYTAWRRNDSKVYAHQQRHGARPGQLAGSPLLVRGLNLTLQFECDFGSAALAGGGALEASTMARG
jgi:hypothetical protein